MDSKTYIDKDGYDADISMSNRVREKIGAALFPTYEELKANPERFSLEENRYEMDFLFIEYRLEYLEIDAITVVNRNEKTDIIHRILTQKEIDLILKFERERRLACMTEDDKDG